MFPQVKITGRTNFIARDFYRNYFKPLVRDRRVIYVDSELCKLGLSACRDLSHLIEFAAQYSADLAWQGQDAANRVFQLILGAHSEA